MDEVKGTVNAIVIGCEFYNVRTAIFTTSEVIISTVVGVG
jgi:hypothetical protein